MKEKPLNLKIRTRDDVIFDSQVDSVSSINEAGKFDVLRRHANFISLIRDQLIIRDLQGHSKNMKINQGIMKVEDDGVFVYLGVK